MPRILRLALLLSGAILIGLILTSLLAWNASAAEFSHERLDRILQATVRGDRVDYDLLRAKHAAELGTYLRSYDDPALQPQSWPRAEALCFWINLYNATMLQAVLDRRGEGWNPSRDEFAVFKSPLVRVAGRGISLDDLEHQVIRKLFAEPRVHVALCCAARSCPPLKNSAWKPASLEADLAAAMRAFLTDSGRNRIDHRKKTLHLSELFEWYAADFGGPAAVPSYVAAQLAEPDPEGKAGPSALSGYQVEFLEYSWELNAAPADPKP